MRRTPLPLLFSVLALSACGEDRERASAESTSARTPNGCEAVSAPKAKDVGQVAKPDERLDPDATYVATVRTNCGDFDITLDVERAPRTTASFVHLALQDFYDGLSFHRVSPGFVIQGGDPLGNGQGGPGYRVREAPAESLTYEKGMVAMAKTAAEPAGTSGSQFFVVTESAYLPPDYALLGRVTRGMDVVERIAAVELAPKKVTELEASTPADPMVITDVAIAQS